MRQAVSAPIIADVRPSLDEMLPKLPRSSNTAEAIGYTFSHWTKGRTLMLELHAASLRTRSNPVDFGHNFMGAE